MLLIAPLQLKREAPCKLGSSVPATRAGIGSRVLAGGRDRTVVGKDSEGAEAVAGYIGGAGTVTTAVAGEPIEGEVVVLAVYSRTLASPPSSTPTSSPGRSP